VLNAWDLLGGKVKLEKAKVAIMGGGVIGCEVADYLLESGNGVTLIEQLPAVAIDMEPYHRIGILEHFKNNQVGILTGRKATQITREGVQVINLENGQGRMGVC
jgi:pyruvate/2-oxoglutarate dehydrogenase complex dihydrolipoamide dehydrogenase (E3) component